MSAISCLIDRPHYGTTYNKGAAPGYYESARMWDLCDLIGAELQSYGAKVGYTRTNKAKDMDLEERGRMAKGYTFLLSPHSNASDDPKTSYVVAMYQVDDHCGEMDEVSKALAKALATNVAKLMGAKAQTWATKSAHDRDGNGYKDDYYGVLRGAHSVHVPAVIIENGFHLVCIGYHIRRCVPAVKLHTFNNFAVGFCSFGFFNCDNAVVCNLIHSVCDKSADNFIACGDSTNSCDVCRTVNFS